MDVSTRVAQVLKEWDLKQQEWAKDGHASTQAAYEAIEKEVTETEDFSLDRSSKVDIILETSEATLSLADKARTFSTHTQYVNSEAVGSTFLVVSLLLSFCGLVLSLRPLLTNTFLFCRGRRVEQGYCASFNCSLGAGRDCFTNQHALSRDHGVLQRNSAAFVEEICLLG